MFTCSYRLRSPHNLTHITFRFCRATAGLIEVNICLMVLCLFLITELVLFCSLDAMFATENTLFAPAIHHIPKQERMSIISGKSATRLSPIRLINHSPLSGACT